MSASRDSSGADNGTIEEGCRTGDSDAGGLTSQLVARLLLLAGVLAGLGNFVLLPVANPEQFQLASDVYYYAAEGLLAGEDIYEVAPPDRPTYSFLYPPIVILVFLPHAILDGTTLAFAIQTSLNVAFAIGLAIVTWRALQRRDVPITSLDKSLIVGFMLVSAHAAINVVNGQVNIWLGFAIAVGFDALDRDRERLAGLAFALAALVKVFPAILGVWLLRNRAWYGVAVAITTGVAGLLAGLVAFGPELTVTYLEDVLLGRLQEETFDGRPDPTVTTDGLPRQLAALGLTGTASTIVGLLILGPVLLAIYHDMSTDRQRIAAMLATVIVTILLFPLPTLYFPFLAFPLVVLFYTLEAGPARALVVAGTLLSYIRADVTIAADVIRTIPLPSGVESAALSATEALFVFVLPPTLGLWLLLGACLCIARPWR